MDICSHSFLNQPMRGRLSIEGADAERTVLLRMGQQAAAARLLGDFTSLLACFVAAEAARRDRAKPVPPAALDPSGPLAASNGAEESTAGAVAA